MTVYLEAYAKVTFEVSRDSGEHASELTIAEMRLVKDLARLRDWEIVDVVTHDE